MLVTVAVALAAPGAARANGRFPQSIDVHFKPGDDQVMALQVTFGLIVTTDGGAHWRWVCEEAVGFGGVYDPDYAFTSSGLLLATTTSADGLRLTRDFCNWSQAPAPLGNTFASQVEVGSDDTIFVAAAGGDDAQIYVSDDDGATIAPRSSPGVAGDWWESLTVAPSTSGATTRLYLTGFRLVSGLKQRMMFRSDDAATTWVPLPITDFAFGGEGADLQIAAVSPTDPDLVYARVFQANGMGIGDDIYRSVDAGQTWTRVFQSGDNVTAVVIRQSGQVVLATQQSGVHVSTDGVTFGTPVATTPAAYCMQEHGGVLYLCSNGFLPDEMALGTGATAGTWTPILAYKDIQDAVSCAEGTAEHDVCAVQRWCPTVCQIGFDDPDCVCVTPTIDAGPGCPAGQVLTDAGSCVAEPPKDSCCNVGGGPGGAALLAVLVALPLTRRRRRRATARDRR